MAEALYLLPGWGMQPALLAPLAEALAAQFEVTLLPLPDSAEVRQALATLEAQVPPGAWLGGWSLGGMLAVALAAQRGAACPGVFSLASNACFSVRDGWAQAMPGDTFAAFLQGCRTQPAATAKRFSLLCSQGSAQPRELARQLAAQPGEPNPAGLELLAALDNRAALAGFSGAQLHLLASDDALVPASAYPAIARLAPQAQCALLEGASHAFPVEAPGACAQRIVHWRRAHG